MKNIITYITESDKDVKNPKLYRLLKKEGLDKIILVKGDGYFYVTSDDDDVYDELCNLESTSIYVNSFYHQSPEKWVEDIKELLKDTKLVKK